MRQEARELVCNRACLVEPRPNSARALLPASEGRVVVPFSATPVFDFAQGAAQSITLEGDVTGPRLVGYKDGQVVSVLICQDAVGGRRFEWPENVRGGMSISLAPNSCSAQQFLSDGRLLWATSPRVTGM